MACGIVKRGDRCAAGLKLQSADWRLAAGRSLYNLLAAAFSREDVAHFTFSASVLNRIKVAGANGRYQE